MSTQNYSLMLSERIANEEERLRSMQEKFRNHGQFLGAVLDPVSASIHSASINAGSFDIMVMGTKQDLVTVLRALTANGFRTQSPMRGKNEWCSYLEHTEKGLLVWLHFTSTVCRMTKVGTRMVEQPIYDVICGEPGETVEAVA